MGYSGIKIYSGKVKFFICQTNDYSRYCGYSDVFAVCCTKKSADFLSLSNFGNGNRRLREMTRFFNPPSQSCCLSHTGRPPIRPVTIEFCNFPVKWAFFSVISRNTVVVTTLAKSERFLLSLNLLRRGLKFGFSAAILAVISSQTLFVLQFTFLKSLPCSLY